MNPTFQPLEDSITNVIDVPFRRIVSFLGTLLLMEGTCPLVESALTRPTVSVSPPARSKHGTALNIFAFNLNNKNDGDRDDAPIDDSDFPTWFKGLKQWPLYPLKPSLVNEVSEEDENVARDDLGQGTLKSTPKIPLVNLVNVEAMLMASGDDTVGEDARELALFELNQCTSEKSLTNLTVQTTPLSFTKKMQELGDWNDIVFNLRASVANLTTESSSKALSAATETIFKEATSRLEYLVSEVSAALSPQTVQSLILRAGKTLSLNEGATNDMILLAEKLAQEQGVDVREAAGRARETAKFTTAFVKMANDLLVAGYARSDTDDPGRFPEKSPSPLFDSFKSVKLVSPRDQPSAIMKAAEMGTLCGAIYEDTLRRTHQVSHSIVANGTAANVVWMVTDSVYSHDHFTRANGTDTGPFLVRTVIIRGFDATDESVDREELLVDVCTAPPEFLDNGVLLHSGLLKIAREIYADVVRFIDTTAPMHKVVFTGHSIGGSLSVLLLFLLVRERGPDFVKNKIDRVYTFGSPPISTVRETPAAEGSHLDLESNLQRATTGDHDILSRFGLPTDIVHGYVQPWDPIVRLFSEIDPLYPLIGDIGEDGLTPYASGPPRTLRPITRAIVESWDGWPRFRDKFKSTVNQNYTSVGVQHILLPEPIRYISDQLVAVNVQIPPIDSIVSVSSEELLPALASCFPVDVFRISFVPAAIRSFVHHFYPAYSDPIVDFAEKIRRRKFESDEIAEDRSIASLLAIKEMVSPDSQDIRIQSNSKPPAQWLQFPPDW